MKSDSSKRGKPGKKKDKQETRKEKFKLQSHKVRNLVNEYQQTDRDPVDLLKALNAINNIILDKNNPDNPITQIFYSVQAEIVGLTTEAHSQKDKIVRDSTRRVISEYMLNHLNEIEREVINSSKSKMKLHQKIRKLINEYLATNYFQKINLITVVDDIIEYVYGDEYTLSKYILEVAGGMVDNTSELRKILMIYQNSIDGSEISDLKIAYRKALIENETYNDILFDVWKKIHSFIGLDGCRKLLNSLYLFNSRKLTHNQEVLNPVIYALKDSSDFVTDDFKKVEINGRVYYGSSIYTLEDSNLIKFERFMSKLASCSYEVEEDLLRAYCTNNINLLTEKVILDKFSDLNEELFNELLQINEQKYKQTCIGHILLSEPTDEIFNLDRSINFVVKMVMESVYKMSEILLTSDFEFQEFQKETLITLQQISKLRDIETANHQDRVTIYTSILAEALRKRKIDGSLEDLITLNKIEGDSDYHMIEREYIRDLLYSASLHDLGKVGINDEILKSSDQLSPQQYEIMKMHTTFGHQRLFSITRMSRKKSFLVLAAALAENHHEKWDGTGYPNKKKKFEIPLSARILAIADVYDALRRKRPYKESYSQEESVEIILDEKGKMFDPVLVDIFFENRDKFDEAFINNITETEALQPEI
jgi:response regulator RpfG family c-di-GMP phosphodiesterase